MKMFAYHALNPMIRRLHGTTREQRKLLFSVGMSFLTRIPGAVGLLWYLPLLHTGIGTEQYAALLSAFALGTAVAFLANGTNTIGRRVIGEAYSLDDRQAEADGFISLAVTSFFGALISSVVLLSYTWLTNADTVAVDVGLFVTVGMFFTMCDDTQAAYNEFYINATWLILFQTIGYAIGLTVSATQHNAILAALVMSGPYSMVSIVTLLLLLWRRPYLLKGRPTLVGLIFRQGTMVALANGFLMITISLSVVWMQHAADADTAAWFATIARLFQTFMMPLVLIIQPLSSYMRIRWRHKSASQQQWLTKIMLTGGVGYGAFVACVLFVVSRFYVSRLLHLPVPNSYAVFLLFGAIIAYKSYSSVAYLVMTEITHLSIWTMVAIGLAIGVGAFASLTDDALRTINAYAFAAAIAIVVVLFWNVSREPRVKIVPSDT